MIMRSMTSRDRHNDMNVPMTNSLNMTRKYRPTEATLFPVDRPDLSTKVQRLSHGDGMSNMAQHNGDHVGHQEEQLMERQDPWMK